MSIVRSNVSGQHFIMNIKMLVRSKINGQICFTNIEHMNNQILKISGEIILNIHNICVEQCTEKDVQLRRLSWNLYFTVLNIAIVQLYLILLYLYKCNKLYFKDFCQFFKASITASIFKKGKRLSCLITFLRRHSQSNLISISLHPIYFIL